MQFNISMSYIFDFGLLGFEVTNLAAAKFGTCH